MDILTRAQEVFGGHKYERYIATICPFHDDSKPSFFIYEDGYRCSACGKWGKDVQKLINQFSSTYIPPTKQFYSSNPFTKWTQEKELHEIMWFAQKNLKEHPSQYLQDRGISKTDQVLAKIGILQNWILFPIYKPFSDSILVGAVARALDPNIKSKYILPAGQDPDMLYCPDWKRVQQATEVYLTFGIIDALSLWCKGRAAMSTTTGKRINPQALDIIRKRIIIIPDQGEEKEAQVIASKLGWRGNVLRLPYPVGCKDINDLVMRGIYESIMVR